ncbi:MAG: hypothetical protein KatS3mg004_3077 [Bryobacteraceae bacterium]|nr:MAG: hypothetical protein KatS3mg004_3077 [Bryobacteraceae bacterium]
MNLNERLQLEKEILERIDQIRSLDDAGEVSEEIERAILERELRELESQLEGEEVLVVRRRRRG